MKCVENQHQSDKLRRVWTHRAGARVALEATVAASVEALQGSGNVLGEVAVATSPDTAGAPVVGDVEAHDLERVLCPTGAVVGDGRADVQVGEDGGPVLNSECPGSMTTAKWSTYQMVKGQLL